MSVATPTLDLLLITIKSKYRHVHDNYVISIQWTHNRLWFTVVWTSIAGSPSRWTSAHSKVVRGCGLGGGSGSDKDSSSLEVSPPLEDSVQECGSSSPSESLFSWSEWSSLEE